MTASAEIPPVAVAPPAPGETFAFGRHALDPETLELFEDGEVVALPPQPARLLVLLVSRAGHLVTREEIRDHLWEQGEHVDADAAINFLVRKLRTALGDDAAEPTFIETLPRRGYRFKAEVERVPPPPDSGGPRLPARAEPSGARVGLVALALLLGLAAWYLSTPEPRSAPEPEPAAPEASAEPARGPTILLGTFDARTGQEELDEGLAVAWRMILERSRESLVLLPSSVDDALRRMRLEPGSTIDRELGIELCLREGIDLLVLARARAIGGRFLVGAEVVDPQSGRAVLSAMEPVESSADLLEALEGLGRKVRAHLGEPARTPAAELDPVTTTSLEALRAYTEAVRALHAAEPPGDHELTGLLRHAIELDPGFGMAHARLAAFTRNLGDLEESVLHFERARELSSRLTRYESLYIDAWITTLREDADCAPPWELLARLYPNDFTAAVNASNARETCSQDYRAALRHARRALAIQNAPEFFSRHHVARVLLALGRWEESLAESARAEAAAGFPTSIGIWSRTLVGRRAEADAKLAECLDDCPSEMRLEVMAQEPARQVWLGEVEAALATAVRFEEAGATLADGSEPLRVKAHLARAALAAELGRSAEARASLRDLAALLGRLPTGTGILPSRWIVPAALGTATALELGEEELARELTGFARAGGGTAPANLASYLDLVEAEWALFDDDRAAAVAALERSLGRPVRAEFLRARLAELLDREGETERAREQLRLLAEGQSRALFGCLGLASCYEETHAALAVAGE